MYEVPDLMRESRGCCSW
uniref:Uncharacterized protein n=1 Tax=Arundo donax TaxID=35708 RepID=A0A0A9BSF9_ARUDO